MKLYISPSEWNVLERQLINNKLDSYKAKEIINFHKKILQDFKEKLITIKKVEVEKYKKELEKRRFKNKDEKILKFESELNEKLDKDFKEKFYYSVQKISGYY